MIYQERIGTLIKVSGVIGSHDWGETNPIGALIGKYKYNCNWFESGLQRGLHLGGSRVLLPNLPTKSVSVMDNTSFHKGIEIRKIIESSCHTLLY
ncbi:hypothetical protein HE1_01080 [Holospora elegans E1]|uniref:Tc1-like transposase DDE domain-containing protein n=1 Tax=Holospora elegans E1 TaxID=1427503 RepID=A0A023DYZ2_9PROT|nr:hypothetical protein HE1_01080 [Holospora elegans E1]